VPGRFPTAIGRPGLPGPGPAAIGGRPRPALPTNLSYPEEPGILANVSVSLGCPWNSAFDPANGYVYVTDYCSDTVSVVSGLGQVTQFAVPGANLLTYDPANGVLYAAGYDGGLWGIRGTSIVSNVSISPPNESVNALAYDPVTGLLYVVGEAGTIAVVSGSNVVRYANVTAADEPAWAVVDSATGAVYVMDEGTNNTTVLQGAAIVATVSGGDAPDGGVYDPANGDVYLTNWATNNVTVLDGTSVVGNVPVGPNAESAVYDPSNGYVYVANFNYTAYLDNSPTGSVSVLSGLTDLATVVVGGWPTALTVQPSNGLVFVADSWAENLSILDGASLLEQLVVYGTPYAAPTVDLANGDVYVSDFGSSTPPYLYANVTVLGPAYQVTFAELGLPADVNWSVTVFTPGTYNGTNASGDTSVAATLNLTTGNGTFEFLANGSYGYVLKGTDLPGTFSVTGADVLVSLTFVPGRSANVTFQEVGASTFYGLLEPGAFCVSVGWVLCGSGSIAFDNLSSGTYAYVILPPLDQASGNPDYYVPQPVGSVKVGHGDLTVAVRVDLFLYPIQFVEQGLPAGKRWTITLWDDDAFSGAGFYFVEGAITPATALTFHLPPGIGSILAGDFLVAWATGPNGYVTTFDIAVTTGFDAQTFSVPFQIITYPVVVTATGLRPGANWSVTVTSGVGWWNDARVVHSERLWSDGSATITVPLPDGTYQLQGRSPGPLAGSSRAVRVMVQGAGTAVSFAWYDVTFSETGLPDGTMWCVRAAGMPSCSTSPTIVVSLPNGTYAFAPTSAAGYWAPGPFPRVAVRGAPVTVSIAFRPGAPLVLF